MEINYLDLFSGIGGFSLGFQRAGFKFKKHFFSEIDRWATSIYKRHFPTAVGLGSITGINPEELGQIDLITFGFPCQDLSIAGKRAGLEGKRSGLFFEATRIIRHTKPALFIFENVEGLLTSNDGKDFEVVLREIADIGIYGCEWQLLNTSWFLPQNRERVYFIGHLAERCGRKVFPIGEDGGEFNKFVGGGMEVQTAQCLNSRMHKMGRDDNYIHQLNDPKHSNDRIYGQYGLSPDTQMQQHTLQGSRIRRLTPVECERLQGFPDGWTETGCNGEKISDSQRYRCIGNAVTVDVVAEIATRLKESEIK